LVGLNHSGDGGLGLTWVAAWQDRLVPFLEAVNAVGGEVQRQGAYVTQAFGAQREMLAAVAERPRPEREEELVAMLEGTTEALACVDQASEPTA
jgi:hypothetical protein